MTREGEEREHCLDRHYSRTKLRTIFHAVDPPIASGCSTADQVAKEDDGGLGREYAKGRNVNMVDWAGITQKRGTSTLSGPTLFKNKAPHDP
jgi:hypothetical protein